MFRTFLNDLVGQTSQLFLLACVGIPGAPLDWLAAKLPGRKV